MTTHRPSAQIYAFPAGGRPRAHSLEQHSGAAVIASLAAARAARSEQITDSRSDCGSGWYHEAAVREAEALAALAAPSRK
jgi:hypothetical protein